MRTPATAAAIAGNACIGSASGRVIAATTPTAPNAPIPATATHGRRREATPRTAAITAATTTIPASRTSLSRSPKVRIAKAFSHSGVRSIAP